MKVLFHLYELCDIGQSPDGLVLSFLVCKWRFQQCLLRFVSVFCGLFVLGKG